MLSPRLLIKVARSCLVLFLILSLNSSGIQPIQAVYAYNAQFTSSFYETSLHPLWTWNNEDPASWSLGYDPSNGYGLKIWPRTGPLKNALSLDAPNGYYGAQVTVNFTPTADGSFAGLRLAQDDDDYAQMVITRENGSPRIAWQVLKNGVASQLSNAFPSSETYVRLTRQGSTYIGEFLDPSNGTWRGLGYTTFSNPLSKIQLVSGAASAEASEVPARFLNFTLSFSLPQLQYENQETFYRSSLSTRWSWLNEDSAHWGISPNNGLTIQTPQTDGHTNVLLRSLPAGDFDLRVMMDFNPDANIQSAGLIIYAGEGDYLTLTKGYCTFIQDCRGIGSGFYFDQVRAGEPIGSRYPTTPTDLPFFFHLLRIIREGNKYSALVGKFDMAGTWELIGVHTPDDGFAPTQVGLKTNSRFQSPSIPATFTVFQLDTQARDGFAVFLPGLFKNLPAGNSGSTPEPEPTPTFEPEVPTPGT